MHELVSWTLKASLPAKMITKIDVNKNISRKMSNIILLSYIFGHVSFRVLFFVQIKGQLIIIIITIIIILLLMLISKTKTEKKKKKQKKKLPSNIKRSVPKQAIYIKYGFTLTSQVNFKKVIDSSCFQTFSLEKFKKISP